MLSIILALAEIKAPSANSFSLVGIGGKPKLSKLKNGLIEACSIAL